MANISKNISIRPFIKPKRQKRSDMKKEFAVYLNEVYLISFDSILACQIFAENLTEAIEPTFPARINCEGCKTGIAHQCLIPLP